MIVDSPTTGGAIPGAARSQVGRVVTPGLESLAAILIATAIASAVLIATGHNPLDAWRELVHRALLRPAGLQETVVRTIPLLIAGSAVLLAARAGLWNIGIDGQVLVGALAAAMAGAWMADVVAPVLWVVAILAAMLAGVAWAVVPAVLRARWGINEVVTTIMFNYLALSLTAWLVKGPLRDPALVAPHTPLIPRELQLPYLADTRIHLGIMLAIAIWIGLGWWLGRTVAGFELRVVGLSPRAARHAMIPVAAVVGIALVSSGAIAAIAGANDVLATKGTFQGEWNPAYGLTAFALVFLARRNVWALLPAALFLGMLSYGADVMPRAAGISSMFFTFFEGVLLAVLAVFRWRPWNPGGTR